MAEQKAFAAKQKSGGGLAGARTAVVRRAKAVVLLPIVAALLAWATVSVVPDRYAAGALVQIDPRQQLVAPSEGQAAVVPPAFEAERLSVEQQIAILKSSSLLDRVVATLHLADDPEFQTRPATARITAPFRHTDPATVAREALIARLTIRRVHNSSLINVGVTSRDAAKAAKIANAIATEYVAQERSGTLAAASKKSAVASSESEKVFASLLHQYGLARALTGARIVEDAKTPVRPAGPKRARIVAASALTTLALMLALAVLLDRDVQHRTRKVEQTLACPHMTSLPAILADESGPTSARRARLIIAEPGCRYAEAVRAACNELAARTTDNGTGVILVTSALPDEGAELFASNIAHYLAVAGQETLLVDCDFQSKGLTRQLTPHSPAGLLDQIAAHEPVENAILRDSLTGVHFLPASSGAPLALTGPAALRSVGFTAAFQHLKARFPTIVISAPPLLEASDVQVLPELAAQIVFLTAWHRTPRALAKKAVSLLGANQRKVAGAVLADISDDRDVGYMSFAAMFDEIRRATRLPTLDRAA